MSELELAHSVTIEHHNRAWVAIIGPLLGSQASVLRRRARKRSRALKMCSSLYVVSCWALSLYNGGVNIAQISSSFKRRHRDTVSVSEQASGYINSSQVSPICFAPWIEFSSWVVMRNHAHDLAAKPNLMASPSEQLQSYKSQLYWNTNERDCKHSLVNGARTRVAQIATRALFKITSKTHTDQSNLPVQFKASDKRHKCSL